MYSRGDPKALDTLELFSNRFTGSVPSSISACTNITWLSMGNNSLTGNITWLSKLRNLEYLDISHNQLSGPIPLNWTGTIPASLFMLSGLRSLAVSNNELSGQLPQVGTDLFTLSIASNRLQGNITSDYFENATKLTMLDMSKNDFSGLITRSICDAPLLEILSLTYNRLEGIIPACISDLNQLYFLDLSHNRLQGELPNVDNLDGFKVVRSNASMSIGRYFSVGLSLDLSGTYRSYDREQMQENNVLSAFDASDNFLEGEIPASLGELTGLMYLSLSNNSFTGDIPCQLGSKLFQLQYLDLRSNRFQGIIPASLCVPLQLAILDVSYNNLTGSIPTCNSMNTKYPGSAFEGNKELCGLPLPKTCNLSSPPSLLGQGIHGNESSWLSKRVSPWVFYSSAAASFCAAFSFMLFA